MLRPPTYKEVTIATNEINFSSSCGPVETFPREMVSRRKILSRSRDDLNLDQAYLQQQQEDEEDVWYQKDKLFKVSGHDGGVNFRKLITYRQ